MDPNGNNQRRYAWGLRNAVGLKWVGQQLFATNMGADHLGDDRPDDTIYQVREGADYGWPYYFQAEGKVWADPNLNARELKRGSVPLAWATFAAHSAPLGLEYFGGEQSEPSLHHCFLVALHGSSKVGLGRGYRIVRIRQGEAPVDFVSGFLNSEKIQGRPCDVLRIGDGAFFFSDDHAGVIYHVAPGN